MRRGHRDTRCPRLPQHFLFGYLFLRQSFTLWEIDRHLKQCSQRASTSCGPRSTQGTEVELSVRSVRSWTRRFSSSSHSWRGSASAVTVVVQFTHISMGATQGARGVRSSRPHVGEEAGAFKNAVDGDGGGVTSSRLPQELRGLLVAAA